MYATKRSVETVPSVSLRASGNPWVIGQDLVSQVPGHIPLKESFSDSKTLSSTLGPVIPAPRTGKYLGMQLGPLAEGDNITDSHQPSQGQLP